MHPLSFFYFNYPSGAIKYCFFLFDDNRARKYGRKEGIKMMLDIFVAFLTPIVSTCVGVLFVRVLDKSRQADLKEVLSGNLPSRQNKDYCVILVVSSVLDTASDDV